MKNQNLQLTLMLLAGLLFLAGCGQLRTTEQATSPAELPPPPVVTQEEPYPPVVIQEKPSSAPVKEKPFTHKVRWAGETLNRISWWYTGSGENWPAIAKANPGFDPKSMMIGDLIIIPRHLLKRQEPMTKEYRTPETVSKELEAIALEPMVAAPQTIELFGPIDTIEENTISDSSEEILPLESLE